MMLPCTIVLPIAWTAFFVARQLTGIPSDLAGRFAFDAVWRSEPLLRLGYSGGTCASTCEPW
jgi:hypothetical protein